MLYVELCYSTIGNSSLMDRLKIEAMSINISYQSMLLKSASNNLQS